MGDSNTQLHWTDEQWNKVRQVVYEEARRARVAGNVLPLYGPLGARYATFVSQEDNLTYLYPAVEVLVYLRGSQVA